MEVITMVEALVGIMEDIMVDIMEGAGNLLLLHGLTVCVYMVTITCDCADEVRLDVYVRVWLVRYVLMIFMCLS